MTTILKLNTIKILLKFAKHVTTQGLSGELPPPEKAEGIELSTYQDATILYEEIEHLKKNDTEEWEKLIRCDFVDWSDPRANGTGYSFEYWYNNVFKHNHCISAFKATVARFLYEQVDNQEQAMLNLSEKNNLMLQYENDYFDLAWKIKSPPNILIDGISPTLDKAIGEKSFSGILFNLKSFKDENKKIESKWALTK